MRYPLAVLALCACAGAPARVKLDAAWPSEAPAYRATHERWTRHGGHSEDWTRIIEVAATLESAEWRAAYTHERAHRLNLPPDEEARLAAEQQTAAADGWEIELVVATAKPEWNDFDKPQSIWRLALAGADGREVVPLTVIKDKRSRTEIATYFPDLQPFYQPYIVKFPRTTVDGKAVAEGGKLRLKVSGPVGAVELTWQP